MQADNSGPTAGVVNDGPGADRVVQASNTTISANWSGFNGGPSGIVDYQWAIGTRPGDEDVQAFTSVGVATSATNAGLGLPSGVLFYVTVRAENGFGFTIDASSNGVLVDAAPPVAGLVIDGGSGYLCQMEPVAHFGLGGVSEVESVTITWPDGAREVVRRPPVGATLTVRYPG